MPSHDCCDSLRSAVDKFDNAVTQQTKLFKSFEKLLQGLAKCCSQRSGGGPDKDKKPQRPTYSIRDLAAANEKAAQAVQNAYAAETKAFRDRLEARQREINLARVLRGKEPKDFDKLFEKEPDKKSVQREVERVRFLLDEQLKELEALKEAQTDPGRKGELKREIEELKTLIDDEDRIRREFAETINQRARAEDLARQMARSEQWAKSLRAAAQDTAKALGEGIEKTIDGSQKLGESLKALRGDLLKIFFRRILIDGLLGRLGCLAGKLFGPEKPSDSVSRAPTNPAPRPQLISLGGPGAFDTAAALRLQEQQRASLELEREITSQGRQRILFAEEFGNLLTAGFHNALAASEKLHQSLAKIALSFGLRLLGSLLGGAARPPVPTPQVPGPGGFGEAVPMAYAAGGGPVEAGRLYMVGERGMELFRPRVAGVMIKRADLEMVHPGQVVLRSIYGAGSQIMGRGPGHWRGRLEIAETDRCSDDQRRAVEAFLSRLRGAEHLRGADRAAQRGKP